MCDESRDVTVPIKPLEGKIKPLEGKADISVKVNVYFQMRFAVQHLMAAAEFSRRVWKVESCFAGQQFGPFFDEILWHATACIFCCAASLEAYANEFFIDRKQNLPDLREDVADKFWEFFEEKPILEKFDLALLLKNRPTFDHGNRPYQDAAALVKLRNALTHFKPEWEWEQKGDHPKLSKHLEGRFKPTPFETGDIGIFPRKWASHDCTSWAVGTCIQFVEKFEAMGGLPSKLGQFKDRLTS